MAEDGNVNPGLIGRFVNGRAGPNLDGFAINGQFDEPVGVVHDASPAADDLPVDDLPVDDFPVSEVRPVADGPLAGDEPGVCSGKCVSIERIGFKAT